MPAPIGMTLLLRLISLLRMQEGHGNSQDASKCWASECFTKMPHVHNTVNLARMLLRPPLPNPFPMRT